MILIIIVIILPYLPLTYNNEKGRDGQRKRSKNTCITERERSSSMEVFARMLLPNTKPSQSE